MTRYRTINKLKGRSITGESERIDYGMQRWQVRKVVNIGGSRSINLPTHLIKWDRMRAGDQSRWKEGSIIEIAMSLSGEFIIRYSAANFLAGDNIGPLYEEEMPDMGHVEVPVRKRRRRRKT